MQPENICSCWWLSNLGKYRIICLSLSIIGIIFNIIRDVVISVYLSIHMESHSHKKGGELYDRILICGLFSIFLGLVSWIVEIALVVSVVKRMDGGLRFWMGINAIVIFASSISFIATAILFGIETISLSFLFDLIRISCQFFIVTKTVPVLSVQVIDDSTCISAYEHLGEL